MEIFSKQITKLLEINPRQQPVRLQAEILARQTLSIRLESTQTCARQIPSKRLKAGKSHVWRWVRQWLQSGVVLHAKLQSKVQVRRVVIRKIDSAENIAAMPKDNNVLIVLTSRIRHAGKTWARRESRLNRLIHGRSGSWWNSGPIFDY
jgi:hypothetical protein